MYIIVSSVQFSSGRPVYYFVWRSMAVTLNTEQTPSPTCPPRLMRPTTPLSSRRDATQFELKLDDARPRIVHEPSRHQTLIPLMCVWLDKLDAVPTRHVRLDVM